MLRIRKFERTDSESVKEISLNSFSLTAFHSDPLFTKEEANEIVWQIWCKPALEQGGRHLLVADYEGEVVGFLIYGGYKSLRQALGLRIASIILIAVKDRFRNCALRVGTTLLTSCITFLKRQDVNLITVGTDEDNSAAIHLYKKAGFETVLQWSTFRIACQEEADIHASIFSTSPHPPETDHPCSYIHPIAFREDPHFTEEQKKTIEHIYADQAWASVGKSGMECLAWKENKSFLLLENQTALSNFLAKPFYRINRICGENHFQDQIKTLPSFLGKRNDSALLEIYLPHYDITKKESLLSSGYKEIHRARTLHLWL